MKFVEVPNLPESAACVLVSGEISTSSADTLSELGVEVIKTELEPALYAAVRFHPDMQLCHLGGAAALCTQTARTVLPNGMQLGVCALPDGKYPGDVFYNAARVGDFLICNSRYTSPGILKYCAENGVEIINVAQGYAKCNICVIDESAIITSDAGIARACAKYPIDVLTVDDERVRLAGFSHGFFGGAAGKLRRDLLAVNGNIAAHKNTGEIIAFARRRGVDIVSLNGGDITDVGSILAIAEK